MLSLTAKNSPTEKPSREGPSFGEFFDVFFEELVLFEEFVDVGEATLLEEERERVDFDFVVLASEAASSCIGRQSVSSGSVGRRLDEAEADWGSPPALVEETPFVPAEELADALLPSSFAPLLACW